jgi:hypothetical protein
VPRSQCLECPRAVLRRAAIRSLPPRSASPTRGQSAIAFAESRRRAAPERSEARGGMLGEEGSCVLGIGRDSPGYD